MILEMNDWIFDIDLKKTMKRYAQEAADHCDCAYCRNFYEAMYIYMPQLSPFLAQFGVHAEAPDMLCPYDVNKDKMWYEGEYVVFGSIIQVGKHSLRCDEAELFRIDVATDDEYDLPQPYFVLSLNSAELPWILEEPMEEVVSPANDPSFLDLMWERLLKKAPESELNS